MTDDHSSRLAITTWTALRGVRAVTWALLVGILAATVQITVAAPPALADDAVTCSLSTDECGTATPAYPPPPMIGNWPTDTTPAQREALGLIEDQAVEALMKSYDLPAEDEASVQTWQRNDVLGAMWLLLLDAVHTPAAQRTKIQSYAASWLIDQARGKMTSAVYSAGYQAGELYAHWAGKDLATYRDLAEHGTQTELADFLHGIANPYDTPDTASAHSGYCTFTPPSPYQDEYDARVVQGCVTTCLNLWGCAPEAPTFDQFVRWGEASAANNPGFSTADINPADYAVMTETVAANAYKIAVDAGISVAEYFKLSPHMAEIAHQKDLIRTFNKALRIAEEVDTVLGLERSIEVSQKIIDRSAAAVAKLMQALNVISVVGDVAGALIDAITAGIKVTTEDQLPGKIAAYVAQARDFTLSTEEVTDTDEGSQAMLDAFVEATFPLPALATCQNPETYRHSTDVPCLTAPPAPRPEDTDPHFMVSPTKPDGTTGTTQVTPTLTLPTDIEEFPTRQVRVNGHWFTKELAIDDPDLDLTTRSLDLAYTTPDGRTALAWLKIDTEGEYTFAGTTDPAEGHTYDPDTCTDDGSCWTSDHIEFLGTDGHPYTARIETHRPDTGTPRVLTTHPTEGTWTKLDTNGFAPGNATGTITYTWQFQKTGCGLATCTTTTRDGFPTLTPDYTAPQRTTATTITHLWQQAGTHHVKLTATDQAGHTATHEFTIDLASVAPQVNPLQVGPRVRAGLDPATLQTLITKAATDDTITLTIDCGDDTPPSRAQTGPAADTLNGTTPDTTLTEPFPTETALTTTHTYTTPGTHTITLTATNRTGGTTTATTTIEATTTSAG